MKPPRSGPGLCCLLVLLALAMTPAQAACRLPASTRSRTAAALRQVEQTWVAALKAGDSAMVGCLLDPGFIDTNWQGVPRTRAQMLAAARTPPPFSQTIAIDHVRVAGDTGIVWGVNTIRSPSGALLVRLRFTDIFLYRHHQWHALAAQETPQRH